MSESTEASFFERLRRLPTPLSLRDGSGLSSVAGLEAHLKTEGRWESFESSSTWSLLLKIPNN
jgi:hypothetical protein